MRQRPDELERGVKAQLDRLSVAALGMFNRGRQDVTEAELSNDLAALAEPSAAEPAQEGQRLIGEFFFVHAAEAQELSAAQRPGATRRCYEFLHATFGEYLVAARAIEELADVAETAFGGRRPREPDDDLLFALLSHRALAVRRPTLTFAAELFAKLADVERRHVLDILETLLSTCRRRHSSDRYSTYRPTSVDRVRELAAYSANLTTLRVLLAAANDPLPIARLTPNSGNGVEAWRSMVTIWRAGLEIDGWHAMLAILQRAGDVIQRSSSEDFNLPPEFADSLAAQLIGDDDLERRLRYGLAIHDELLYWRPGDRWVDMMRSWLIPAVSGYPFAGSMIMQPPPPDTTVEEVQHIAEYAVKLLRNRYLSDKEFEGALLKFLFAQQSIFEQRLVNLDPYVLAATVIGNLKLIQEIPELRDPELYAKARALPLVIQVVEKHSSTFAISTESEEWKEFRDTIKQSANAWPSRAIPEDLSRAVADLLVGLKMLDNRGSMWGREKLPGSDLQRLSKSARRGHHTARD